MLNSQTHFADEIADCIFLIRRRKRISISNLISNKTKTKHRNLSCFLNVFLSYLTSIISCKQERYRYLAMAIDIQTLALYTIRYLALCITSCLSDYVHVESLQKTMGIPHMFLAFLYVFMSIILWLMVFNLEII